MTQRQALFIADPTGRGGAGLETFDRFRELMPEACEAGDLVVTERQAHAVEIASAARGYDVLVAVGGDGTVSEIMTGIMASDGPRPPLAIVPCGTGNDLARNVGI